jgi:hypothetical protein
MAGIGLIAGLLEFSLIYALISFASYGSNAMAFLVTLFLMGGTMFWLWIQTPRRIGLAEHEVALLTRDVTLTLAPAMGPVWTYAVGTLEIDRSFAERILAVLAFPQRMLCTAWQVWLRFQKLQQVNASECAKVLRLLFKKSERVGVDEIDEQCSLEDLPRTMHELSLIDGVVFLTRGTVGLSLANRLIDDLNAWKSKQKPEANETVFGD